MALVKSSSHSTPVPRDEDAPALGASTPVARQEEPARKANDFGRNPNSKPSSDTYVKLRYSDSPDMPETWFKLFVHQDGVHEFQPTTREHPVVLLMSKGDSKLRMYHMDNAGNFGGVGPQRFEGVLAEMEVRKRRDSTPDNPQFFLVGTYFQEGDRDARELRGNMVGAQSKELMQGMSHASYLEWKAAQPARESAAPAPVPVETVAGQELSFGV